MFQPFCCVSVACSYFCIHKILPKYIRISLLTFSYLFFIFLRIDECLCSLLYESDYHIFLVWQIIREFMLRHQLPKDNCNDLKRTENNKKKKKTLFNYFENAGSEHRLKMANSELFKCSDNKFLLIFNSSKKNPKQHRTLMQLGVSTKLIPFYYIMTRKSVNMIKFYFYFIHLILTVEEIKFWKIHVDKQAKVKKSRHLKQKRWRKWYTDIKQVGTKYGVII